MNKRIVYIAIIIFIFTPFLKVKAIENHGIVVNPAIIDEKAEARDILEYVVKVKNERSSRVSLYPIVNDVLKEGGKQEFLDPGLLDKAVSLARWIKFSRGVIELMPGEEKEVDLTINVNLSAKPGKYYATIVFANGSNLPAAEETAKELNQPQLAINIEVEEHVVEKLQILQFKTEKNINLSLPVSFILDIENTGNRELEPKGAISIYNRKGEEVDLIDINSDKLKIGPNENKNIVFSWQAPKSLGKYKAKLNIEYGDKESRDLQDTIYFWVLPWITLSFFIGLVFILIVFLAIIIFKKTNHHGQQKNYRSEIINLK